MKTRISLLILIVIPLFGFSQSRVIDNKGTLKTIDESKWTLSGSDIFLKQSGNVGIGTASPTAKLHVNGSTLFETKVISNKASGGVIGTAAETVDNYTSINLNQSTIGQTLSLPAPTNTTAGRILQVNNIGEVPVMIGTITINANKTACFVWNGTVWAESAQVISLTTSGMSGAATFSFNTLNIPNYTYTLPVAGASTLGGVKVGSGLAVDGAGTISATNSGTVTSVGLSLPAEITVTNTPVTSGGTLTGTWTIQTANTFFAASSAVAGTPTFRSIVAADIPTLNQNTTGSAASFTGSLGGDVTGNQATTVVKKINGTSLAALATGILKNTTTTGVPTIAVAGTDYLTPTGSAASLTSFPTLNQNTTGSAASFTGSLGGDVTGNQATTVVGKINGTSLAALATGILKNTTTTGVPTIAVAGTDYLTPTGSAASLTSFPTLNQNTTGSAASFTGSLGGDVTGTQAATVVSKINGTSLAALATGILKNTTTTGVPTVAVAADFPILNQNTTGSAASFTGSLGGDVTGNQATTVVKKINGTSLAALATGILKNTTTTGVPTIAVAGTDYLTPTGSAASLTSFPTLNQNTTGSAASFTGSLGGDVTGNQATTVVGKINGTSLAALATGILKNTTTTGVPAIAVAADFPILNQNTTGSAASFTGSLAGDVIGTQAATVVGKINGTSLATLATGILKNTTTTGVPTIAVAADFPILNQNTTGSAASFTGSLGGDVTGNQATTVVKKINGTSLAALATGILKNTTTTGVPTIAVAGTDYLTPTGSAASLTSFPTLNQNTTGSAASFTGSLGGDVTGTQAATVVSKINGTSLAALATGILKNTTTTGVPTVAVAADFPILNQNTTGSAASFTGSLGGDVTGNQATTVVKKINGTSLAALATGILKNTTTTGVPTIAVAGTDYLTPTGSAASLTSFPTLNQNTTGSATSFTGSLGGDVTGNQSTTVVSKINGTSLAALATGILKNTTATGVPTIAVAGSDYLTPTGSAASLTNFPTLNQNTTGSAASFTGSLGGDITGNQATTVVGKINGTSLAALATGILKNTTTTGVPTIAVAADFPILNQNTTGSAASFTGSLGGDVTGTQAANVVGKINGVTLGTTTATDKNILIANGTSWSSQTMSGDVTIGNTGVTAIGSGKVTNTMLAGSIDLTSKVSGILPITNGGTGSATQNWVDLTTTQTSIGGAKTWTGLGTFSAGLTASGAVVALNNNSNSATNINTGTSNAAVNIASGATGGNTITIGNANGTTSLTQKVGTGNYSLDGVGGSTYKIGASTVGGTIEIGGIAQTGVITLGNSTAAQTVNVGTGTGASTVNLANGTAGNTVSIANGTNTAAQTINIGAGASAANNNINIGSGTNTGGVTAVTIGTNTNLANTTTIEGGNGVGAISLIPHTTGSIVIGASVGTGAITLGNSTAPQTVNVGTGTGASTVNIGNTTTNNSIVAIKSQLLRKIGTVITTTSSLTLTAQNMAKGSVFQLTGTTARTFTLDTGANLSAALPGVSVGDMISFVVSNASNRTITMAGGVGTTLGNVMTVTALQSRTFYAINTGTNTWTIY